MNVIDIIYDLFSSFAAVAKKVNVKRLKSDIWTHIDELAVMPSSAGTEDASMLDDESVGE